MARVTDHELVAFEVEEIWVKAGTPRVDLSPPGEVGVMDTLLHDRIRPRALGVVVPVGNREQLGSWRTDVGRQRCRAGNAGTKPVEG